MSNSRRRLTGVVTRAKSQKTISVKVDQSYRHPLYQKVVRSSKSYLVHDEMNCRPGDQVRIIESRPISRRKRWAVESVLRRATEQQVEARARLLVDDSMPEGQE
jgi:small subunit ribosomal protein S17